MISGTTTAAAAGTWTLGDRIVNRLGFGAMRLTGTGGMGRGVDRDPDRSAVVVRRAVDLGVNHIDTAGFYFSASGRANAIIRDALAPYPDDLTIVTKVGPGRDLVTGEWGDWARPDQLQAHVEHNLETLGLERLHVVNYRSSGRDDVPAAVSALAALRDEGLLDHIGLSNVGTEALAGARSMADIVCVQNRHAAGYERSDTGDVLAACREHGIAFVPFFTIAAQAREGTSEERYDVVEAIARAHDATPAQVRIAWNVALGDHVLAIPGTGDVAHLEQNVAAASLRLSEADLAALGRLGSG
ncbi:MAG TPA: aldo/keto reductase [Nocardioides sp.]|uniref:aldo/keto reductase n=1 Tax=Nocardioides sp. TaxID=35761 RepID=UPI002F3E2E63